MNGDTMTTSMMKRGARTAIAALALGLCALGFAARPAAAQIDPQRNPILAGIQWQGFAWNPNASPNGGASLAIWSVQGSSFTGGVSYMGRGHMVNGRVSMADGSVTLVDALNSPPLTLTGRISPTPAGGYMATLAVSQSSRGLGTVKMLWLRNKFTRDGLFPPGPCFSLTVGYSGKFQSFDGEANGLIALLFDPERKAGDSANPPSIED